jgi:hypothetical protein
LRYKHSDLTSSDAAESYEKESMFEHISELGMGRIHKNRFQGVDLSKRDEADRDRPILSCSQE